MLSSFVKGFIIMMLLCAQAFSSTCGNTCPTCPLDKQHAQACPPPAKTIYNPCPSCCAEMGGVQYCDKSSGRFICNNGYEL